MNYQKVPYAFSCDSCGRKPSDELAYHCETKDELGDCSWAPDRYGGCDFCIDCARQMSRKVYYGDIKEGTVPAMFYETSGRDDAQGRVEGLTESQIKKQALESFEPFFFQLNKIERDSEGEWLGTEIVEYEDMPYRGHEKMHLLSKICIDAYEKLARVGSEKVGPLPLKCQMKPPVSKVKKQKTAVDKITSRIEVRQQPVVVESRRPLDLQH